MFDKLTTTNAKKIIKNLLPIERIDLHGFRYSVTELVQMYENSDKATDWHGEIISNKFLKYKNSETLFILGSGPSINEISLEVWDHISKHDSIGFNFWFAHDFVPNMYMFQIPRNDIRRESMVNIFQARYKDYKNIPFILRGSGFANGLLEKNNKLIELLEDVSLYYLNEYPISSKCSIEPNLLYRYMDALGYMTHGKIKKFIPKWRGTLGLLLMLAYQMGYKKIVLCGMDMNGNDHFWDYDPYIDIKEQYSLPSIATSKIKAFTDTTESKNTVPKYVYTLRDWFKKKNDVDVYVMKKKTVLYPEIELYKS